jgi:two-component system sensor histidine kinase KdpD
MDRDDRRAVWLVLGVGGAIVLGAALVPLRATVSASTLAFAFVALTVIVAEVGGPGPGLAAAVVSAMSLNFFLTRPYLSLAIERGDDLVAFLGLAACGLIAAGFGARRARIAETADRTRWALAVLARTAERLAAGAPWDEVLEVVRRGLDLGGLALRRPDERLIAAAPLAAAARPVPPTQLDHRGLIGSDARMHRLGRAGFRVPERGARLPVRGREPLLLDVWEGSPDGLGLEQRDALAIAAVMIALGESACRPEAPGRSVAPPGLGAR